MVGYKAEEVINQDAPSPPAKWKHLVSDVSHLFWFLTAGQSSPDGVCYCKTAINFDEWLIGTEFYFFVL